MIYLALNEKALENCEVIMLSSIRRNVGLYQPLIMIKLQLNDLNFVMLSFGRCIFYSLKINRGNV